jgi:hypothetical protein
MSKLLVEFDCENRNVFWPPTTTALRGKFDAQLAARRDKDAGPLLSEWPDGIPGQQLSIDADTGEVALVEPLHDPRFAATAERVKSRGCRIFPEREKIAVDLPTAVHWVNVALAAKQARIVSGTVPRVEGKPQLDFIVTPRESNESRLATALADLAAAQRESNELIAKVLTALASRK